MMFEDEEEKTADTTVNLELLQEKQDQIDQLQDELQSERDKLNETLKLVADLKEEITILEGQLENSKNEKELIRTKEKQYIHKIQQLQELSQDKDEEIQKLTAEKEILTNAKNIIKKSYDGLNLKFKTLQDENIIIPKKGKEEQK